VVTVEVELSSLKPGFADSSPDHEQDERGILKLVDLSPEVSGQVLARLMSKDFSAWADALTRVGNCARPVRLRGTSDRIDPVTLPRRVCRRSDQVGWH
jgi:hypothetical protein